MISILLISCKSIKCEPIDICPPIIEYSDEFKSKARNELKTLGKDSNIWKMMTDYAIQRAMTKECKKNFDK